MTADALRDGPFEEVPPRPWEIQANETLCEVVAANGDVVNAFDPDDTVYWSFVVAAVNAYRARRIEDGDTVGSRGSDRPVRPFPTPAVAREALERALHEARAYGLADTSDTNQQVILQAAQTLAALSNPETAKRVEVTDGTLREGDVLSYEMNEETRVGQITSHTRAPSPPSAAPVAWQDSVDLAEKEILAEYYSGRLNGDQRIRAAFKTLRAALYAHPPVMPERERIIEECARVAEQWSASMGGAYSSLAQAIRALAQPAASGGE